MPCADVLTKRCGGTTMSDGREEERVCDGVTSERVPLTPATGSMEM
jgi:hypothetical protein